jgi:gntP: transporter, gluconate:H+ symporter (GntP) family
LRWPEQQREWLIHSWNCLVRREKRKLWRWQDSLYLFRFSVILDS